MHDAARHYVAQFATPDPITVFELGSRNVNGSVRDLFPNAAYTGVDVADGNGVDVIADAATWTTPTHADVVICCETFEHTKAWAAIVSNVGNLLASGGRCILTMAGPGRAPHSAHDGGHIRDHEYYRNIEPDELWVAMSHTGLSQIELDVLGEDLRATGVMA